MTLRISLDRGRPLAEQPDKGHNRWHPDIPPIASVDPGERVELETLDAVDGQITPHTTAAGLGEVDRRAGHALTGPLHINGAMPGDLLAVHIESIEPQPFGYTANFADFGFLRDNFPDPGLLRWKIAGGYATSDDLPGVRMPDASFMGVMGVAPSHELFDSIVAREAELAARGGRVAPPTPHRAVPAGEPIASTGLRTAPPRENGGNVDIKQTTAGTTVYLPVFVPGALFSTGDAHFAQGDGEVCGTAIEMGATVVARFEVIKGGAAGQQDLSFAREEYFMPAEFAAPRRFFASTGVCVHKDGRNESEDVTLAARNALLNMIEHLERKYGYTPLQAYLLCSVAVDLKISQIVDLPNVLVTAFLPLDIFHD